MPDPIDPDQPTPITARMTGSGGVWQPPSVEEAAQLFPQYEVLALIGRGGMGAVYQARQIALDRFVAIKLLPLEVSADQNFADRFVREARTMGKLNHPNIIAVYDFGQTHAGHWYFAMEFVEGTNLHQVIHGPGLEPLQVLSIIGEVCDALAYAHGKGVVHRDIKPANVMLNTEGHVKVADFGLARLTDPSAEQLGHTQTGFVMGTPDYMAPEQKRGMNVDHRADIYSLGVMLYEMLCRETPQGIFDPPSHRVPVDARVDQVVVKAMQQTPERRFQSSTEMKSAVDIIRTMPAPKPRGGAAGQAHRSPAEQPEQPRGNPRALLYAGIAVAAVAIVGAFVFINRPKPKRTVAVVTPISRITPLPQTPAPIAATPTPEPATPMPVAAATPAPTALPSGGPKQTFNLIGALDLARDRVKAGTLTKANNWTLDDGRLTYMSDGAAGKITAPVNLAGSREYSFELEFRPLGPASVFTLDLPVAPALQSGLDFQPGVKVELGLKDGARQKIGDWPAGQGKGRLLVLVKFAGAGPDGSVTVWFNDQQIAQWSGALATIGKPLEPHPDFPGQQMPSLFCFRDSYEFTNWTLRVFEGEASKPPRSAPPETAPSAAVPLAARAIFDGKSFAGWHGYGETGAPSGWRIEDGLLVGLGERKTLVSDEMFGDFELSLEWRVKPGGNGGAFYLIGGSESGDRVIDCPEMNLMDDELSPANKTGALFNVQEPTAAAARPLGEWNTAKLIHRAGKAEHWVNDQLVCAYDLANTKFGAKLGGKGRIGLQSWTGEIAYRNVMLRSLDPVGLSVLPASPAPAPAAATSKAAPEVVKWLAEQDVAFTTQWKAEAVAPFDTAVARLRSQYVATIEKGIADATKAGKLEDAIAWKNEQARITAQQPHEAEDAATDPAALKQLRARWRVQFAKLDAERFAKAKTVHQRFDSLLATGQTGYTQKQRFDDALLLKAKRDEIAKLWLEPALDISQPAGSQPAMGEKLAPPKPASVGTGTLAGREALEWFLAMNGSVAFEDASGAQQSISAPNEQTITVPKGKLEVVSVSFDRNKRDGSPITDQDFEKVAPQRRLTSFVLTAPQVTGSGLSFLAGCSELTSVSLNLPSFTDAALVPLLGLRKLTQLGLSGGAQSHSWSRFAEMASLPVLGSFTANGVENFPATALGRMKKMRALNLQATRLSDEQLAAIGAMPELDNLTIIGLDGTGAASLRHLASARKVVALNITGCSGIEPHLGFIGKMRSLSMLHVDGQNAIGLAAAAGAPALRTIYLGGGTDAAFKVIADSFPKLEALGFMDATERTVTAEGIRSLARMPKLKTFTWGKRPLPADFAAALAALPTIERLIVADSGIEDAQLIEFAKSKTLTALDLSHQKLHPAALEVLKTMRSLRELTVYNCGLTPGDIATLRKALLKCVVRDS